MYFPRFFCFMSMCLGLVSACVGMAAPGGPKLKSVGIIGGEVLATTIPPFTLPGSTATTATTSTTSTTTTIRPITLPALTPVPPASSAFPLIDPRLGLASGGESVTEPTGNPDIIGFPKNKRSIPDRFVRNKRQSVNCACVLPSQCTNNTFGAGLIDFRIGPVTTCAAGFLYCCSSTTSSQVSCGSRVQTASVYPTLAGQTKYGDYPWMVVILTTDNKYIGGGTLLDMQNIITTAHRISAYPNGVGLKIRIGEWDLSGTYEQYPSRDFTIARVWVHESYNPSTLQNDIALIRLVGGIPAGTPGVVPACLPTAGQVFDGMRCWVSGWGQDAFGPNGRFQTVLKAVDVPIIAAASCETNFRTTRLGTAFTLDRTAFLCAGAEVNKDSCTGDGGSGLVCEVSQGRWTVAGLVAWGLGCATQGVPAAYVNIVNYLPWIQARQSMAA